MSIEFACRHAKYINDRVLSTEKHTEYPAKVRSNVYCTSSSVCGKLTTACRKLSVRLGAALLTTLISQTEHRALLCEIKIDNNNQFALWSIDPGASEDKNLHDKKNMEFSSRDPEILRQLRNLQMAAKCFQECGCSLWSHNSLKPITTIQYLCLNADFRPKVCTRYESTQNVPLKAQ